VCPRLVRPDRCLRLLRSSRCLRRNQNYSGPSKRPNRILVSGAPCHAELSPSTPISTVKGVVGELTDDLNLIGRELGRRHGASLPLSPQNAVANVKRRCYPPPDAGPLLLRHGPRPRRRRSRCHGDGLAAIQSAINASLNLRAAPISISREWPHPASASTNRTQPSVRGFSIHSPFRLESIFENTARALGPDRCLNEVGLTTARVDCSVFTLQSSDRRRPR